MKLQYALNELQKVICGKWNTNFIQLIMCSLKILSRIKKNTVLLTEFTKNLIEKIEFIKKRLWNFFQKGYIYSSNATCVKYSSTVFAAVNSGQDIRKKKIIVRLLLPDFFAYPCLSFGEHIPPADLIHMITRCQWCMSDKDMAPLS